MAQALTPPPLSPDDRIPHSQAVWREGRPVADLPATLALSVDYGKGIVQLTEGEVDWPRVKRWRFGHG